MLDFEYPTDWWRKPEFRAYKKMARRFVDDHPREEWGRETRFAVIKGILAGLIIYSPKGKTVEMRKLD